VTERVIVRRPVRLVLDSDVLAQVEADAAAHGMTTERWAERLLAERLPLLLAETAAAFVNESIRLADARESESTIVAGQSGAGDSHPT